MNYNITKSDLIELNFTCCRETQSLITHILELKKECDDFEDILKIMKSMRIEERTVIFNKIHFNKQNKKDIYECLCDCDKFKQYKDMDNYDLISKFNKCEIYLKKEKMHMKMYCTYINNLLDDYLLEISEKTKIDKINNKKSIKSGTIGKLTDIIKYLNIKNITTDEINKVFLLNRIRNDIVHNKGIVGKETIKYAKTYFNMKEYDLRSKHDLYNGKEIKIEIKDLILYIQIVRDILKKIYEGLK